MEMLVQEVLKVFGPAGLVSLVLIYALRKSEQREEKKDQRIQLLENQLIESYDERITAADQVSTALLESSKAIEALRYEMREKANDKRTGKAISS